MPGICSTTNIPTGFFDINQHQVQITQKTNKRFKDRPFVAPLKKGKENASTKKHFAQKTHLNYHRKIYS